jgi:hypothetical protein
MGLVIWDKHCRANLVEWETSFCCRSLICSHGRRAQLSEGINLFIWDAKQSCDSFAYRPNG